MELRFIGQGYNLEANTSVVQVLIDSLANNNFHTFKCMVAFASPSGVSGLTEHINNSREHIETTRVVIGIDQGATSKEALEKLLEWNAEVFVFYSAQPNIFHPKIYIFEGNNVVSILIGSNNLTEMGLVKNIESSVLITFNKDETDADNLLNQINEYFETILSGENPNLKQLTTELIELIVEQGIVPTEAERRAKYSKDLRPSVQEEDNDTSIVNIRTLFPSIGLQNLPENFRPERRERIAVPVSHAVESDDENLVISTSTSNYVEVWKSKPLTERDLNIPSGTNTNATGSMLLKRGLLANNIDHRHYFRDVVFNDLNWVSGRGSKSHLERAVATFKLKIDGVNKGEFRLSLGHNTRTDIKTYKQNNAMSQLHWGRAKDLIANRTLLGKTLTLFKDPNSDDEYAIEIQ